MRVLSARADVSSPPSEALSIHDRAARELEAHFEADLEHCVAFSAAAYEARKHAARFVD